MKHGKKYQDSTKLVDTAVLYDTTEAIENRKSKIRRDRRDSRKTGC